jgi:hypothetical protein
MFTRRLLAFSPPVRSMAMAMATTTTPNPNLVNVNVNVNVNAGPRERLIRAKVAFSPWTKRVPHLSSTVDRHLYAHLSSDT